MTDNNSSDVHQKVPKVLAVSSGGGHWAELLRLRPAWAGAKAYYAVTEKEYRCDLEDEACEGKPVPPGFFVVPDANKSQKVRLLFLAMRMAWIVLRVRPDIVVSTGAAPGYFAILFAKRLGAKTVWVDSIANADEMSVSGVLAQPHSDKCFTQWPHLVASTRSIYKGAVM